MKKLFVIFMLLMLFKQLPAQNYKFQALFIYNIAQGVEWPEVNNAFVIGVVGTKELQRELENISQKRELFGHRIDVRPISPSRLNIGDCHLVYVGRTWTNKISEIKSLTASKPVLLISDKPGVQDVCINFIDNSAKIQFEVFPNTIKEHHLNITSSLLNLGIVK